MTTGRMVGSMLALAAALAACGGQGGELAEDTARRRAAAAQDEVPGRMPAFVLSDSSPVAIPPTPAGVDTAKAAAPATPPARPTPQDNWTAGIMDQVRTMHGPVVLSDLRVGVNQGFDRVVLEFLGSHVPGYRVEYVDRPVRQCGSGDPVRLAGDAWLAITLRGTQAHDERGQATVQPRERRLQMPVIREYEFSCDFEGEVQVVLGVSSPNRYRVTELKNPARLIVDVQQ